MKSKPTFKVDEQTTHGIPHVLLDGSSGTVTASTGSLMDNFPLSQRVDMWLKEARNLRKNRGCTLPENDDCGDPDHAFPVAALESAKELGLAFHQPVAKDPKDKRPVMLFQHVMGLMCRHCSQSEKVDALKEAAAQVGISMVKATSRSREPIIYYDRNKHLYYTQAADEVWQSHGLDVMRTELAMCGLAKSAEADGTPAEVDQRLSEIRHSQAVDFAMELAGYRPGLVTVDTKRILVTRGLRLIEPCKGSWHTINAIFKGLFGEHRHTVYAILKRDYEALRDGTLHIPGQATAIAGEHESGKTLFINRIVIPVLGGTWARPYEFMSGRTTFNGEWTSATTLLIDDEVAHADLESRRNFGAQIKKIVGSPNQYVNDKGVKAVGLQPFWRIWIACNNEPESLRTLPPMTDNLPDKIHLFKGHKLELPMSVDTVQNRTAFEARIAQELPAFIYWLTQRCKPDAEIMGGRFMVKTHHDAQIMAQLLDLAPEMGLLGLIDQTLFELDGSGPVVLSATELESRLRKQSERQFERICTYNGALGTYLNRLAQERPDRVAYVRKTLGRRWQFMPAPSDEDETLAIQEGGRHV